MSQKVNKKSISLTTFILISIIHNDHKRKRSSKNAQTEVMQTSDKYRNTGILVSLSLGLLSSSSTCYGPLGPLLFPLLVFVVPLGCKALHRINSHVQHPLELLLLVLRLKCVWNRSIHCKDTLPNDSVMTMIIASLCV